jgi:hypothetical protein
MNPYWSHFTFPLEQKKKTRKMSRQSPKNISNRSDWKVSLLEVTCFPFYVLTATLKSSYGGECDSFRPMATSCETRNWPDVSF